MVDLIVARTVPSEVISVYNVVASVFVVPHFEDKVVMSVLRSSVSSMQAIARSI